WISARLRSHYRAGLEWAIWVTRVSRRREDRSSISFHPLADLGGETATMSLLPPYRYSSFVRAVGRSFVPACRVCGASRAGAVEGGRRVAFGLARPAQIWLSVVGVTRAL